MIAAHCYIIDADHGTSINEKICNQKNNVDKVLIGKDCWLGHSVTVLRGSDIGDGAVVGAMSLIKGAVKKIQ